LVKIEIILNRREKYQQINAYFILVNGSLEKDRTKGMSFGFYV
jgi:hypothetical protein